MDANRKSRFWPGARDGRRPRQLRSVVGRQNDHGRGQPRGAATLGHGVEIARELGSGDVAVRIDHRTRAPAGMLSSTASSVGGPPSTLAASTMPFDSSPINFAGFRLATMTIVRPLS